MSPWTATAIEIVMKEGRIRERELVELVAGLVPPSRAFHFTIANRRRNQALSRQKGARVGRPKRLSADPQRSTLIGQRGIAQRSIYGLAMRGVLRYEYDEERWVLPGDKLRTE